MKFTVKNTCPRELDLKVQVRDVEITTLIQPDNDLPLARSEILPATVDVSVITEAVP